jgi:hypothetical protein
MDMSKGWRRGDYQKKYWNGGHQGEGNEADENLPGQRVLEKWSLSTYPKYYGSATRYYYLAGCTMFPSSCAHSPLWYLLPPTVPICPILFL